MSINEFQNGEIDNNNIVDPNLRRRPEGTQSFSTIVDPNVPRQKRVVTPQEMGFTHEEVVLPKRPEDPILERAEKAIARKQREARLLAQAIDESDGEGVSEEEFQDLLVQAREELADDGIPTEEDLREQVMPKKSTITMLSDENPAQDLMAELEAEFEEDEADYRSEIAVRTIERASTDKREENYYTEEVKDEPVPRTAAKEETKPEETVDNPFSNFESGDINFDEENEELEDNIDESKIAEKEQKEQLDKLRALVSQKIRPITRSFDISTYSVSKRPAANVISTPRDRGEKIADWVLMNSQKPIYMKRFTGTEMERLSNGGKGRTRLNRALDTWQLIYSHIVDPNKPNTLEEWAKVTSFLDIDHIYMAMYRANFDGSNYIPYNYLDMPSCGCREVFLSDNFDIMDMCKFSSKEAKEKFNSIIGTETSMTSGLYSTEIVPVSDEYAFVFREPSIYNIIIESAVLDQEFVEKFGDLVSICAYIDEIYRINHETRELQPVRTNIYPNNMKKTVKSRIINFSRYISQLDSDQYNTIIAYINKINETGNDLTYQIPEVTCPHCKSVINATASDAQSLVFTRHQLATLATL